MPLRLPDRLPAIEFLVPHLLEVAIEGPHVFDGCILACVCLDLHQVDFKLQGTVGEQSYEVGLCGDFQRHKVENHDTQGANILRMGTCGVHYEDILLLEQINSRKAVRNS